MFMYIGKRVKRLTLTVLCVSIYPHTHVRNLKTTKLLSFFFLLSWFSYYFTATCVVSLIDGTQKIISLSTFAPCCTMSSWEGIPVWRAAGGKRLHSTYVCYLKLVIQSSQWMTAFLVACIVSFHVLEICSI